MPEQEPGDRWMLVFNLVGLAVVAVLLTAFLLMNGASLGAFLQFLQRPEPWPDL